MNEINVTVFHNHRTLTWRMRDADCNRFKIYGDETTTGSMTQQQIGEIDPDDCTGAEFATICLVISGMPRLL